MTTNEYLLAVLTSQDLPDDSAELKDLQARRKDVEAILRNKFSDSAPTIRYGGSKAKGTLIREYYDLDLTCYFAHDDTAAGETLKDIYDNVAAALEDSYYVEKKTSALRLKSKDVLTYKTDFHIDVVPGRFIDNTKTDAFLYQNGGDKGRLKTNLDVHIKCIRESGVLDAIRLLKLWKVRRALGVKQFAFELLIIELLAKKKDAVLADQLEHVLTQLKDLATPPSIKDPANPNGNDLTPFLKSVWGQLSSAAASTLLTVQASGWEGVFGPVETARSAERVALLRSAAAAVATPTKPWCKDA
jgi:hypothetical protein